MTGKPKIVIIGAGPMGLTSALLAIQQGYNASDILILEKRAAYTRNHPIKLDYRMVKILSSETNCDFSKLCDNARKSRVSIEAIEEAIRKEVNTAGITVKKSEFTVDKLPEYDDLDMLIDASGAHSKLVIETGGREESNYGYVLEISFKAKINKDIKSIRAFQLSDTGVAFEELKGRDGNTRLQLMLTQQEYTVLNDHNAGNVTNTSKLSPKHQRFLDQWMNTAVSEGYYATIPTHIETWVHKAPVNKAINPICKIDNTRILHVGDAAGGSSYFTGLNSSFRLLPIIKNLIQCDPNATDKDKYKAGIKHNFRKAKINAWVVSTLISIAGIILKIGKVLQTTINPVANFPTDFKNGLWKNILDIDSHGSGNIASLYHSPLGQYKKNTSFLKDLLFPLLALNDIIGGLTWLPLLIPKAIHYRYNFKQFATGLSSALIRISLGLLQICLIPLIPFRIAIRITKRLKRESAKPSQAERQRLLDQAKESYTAATKKAKVLGIPQLDSVRILQIKYKQLKKQPSSHDEKTQTIIEATRIIQAEISKQESAEKAWKSAKIAYTAATKKAKVLGIPQPESVRILQIKYKQLKKQPSSHDEKTQTIIEATRIIQTEINLRITKQKWAAAKKANTAAIQKANALGIPQPDSVKILPSQYTQLKKQPSSYDEATQTLRKATGIIQKNIGKTHLAEEAINAAIEQLTPRANIVLSKHQDCSLFLQHCTEILSHTQPEANTAYDNQLSQYLENKPIPSSQLSDDSMTITSGNELNLKIYDHPELEGMIALAAMKRTMQYPNEELTLTEKINNVKTALEPGGIVMLAANRHRGPELPIFKGLFRILSQILGFFGKKTKTHARLFTLQATQLEMPTAPACAA